MIVICPSTPEWKQHVEIHNKFNQDEPKEHGTKVLYIDYSELPIMPGSIIGIPNTHKSVTANILSRFKHKLISVFASYSHRGCNAIVYF